jgi:hypothetical protein
MDGGTSRAFARHRNAVVRAVLLEALTSTISLR